MGSVAVATSSALSAQAGARVAEAGGNAVDVAVAAAMVSAVTEPGIVALGGGSFITVWEPDHDPVVIDGYVEMPGRGLPADRFGGGVREVHIGYGGGVDTTVGHGSVGTPGTLAAFGLASRRFGALPWRALVEPAYECATAGFPLPRASYDYLKYSHELIYGWSEPSYRALHRADGKLRGAGESIRVEELAASLRAIADRGPETFYEGELADLIIEDSRLNGGLLTARDLSEYRAEVRPPLQVDMDGWRLATNPPPAIGGATLCAILLLLDRSSRTVHEGGEGAYLKLLADVQRAVFDFRRRELEPSDDLPRAAGRLLELARRGDARLLTGSPSTTHTSAVDSSGLGCSITTSFGYGSGVMPPGTGIWMNNCLGELELNPHGLHAWPPGTRLPSNMAPSVARHSDGGLLVVGSPGASRITTAIAQTLSNFIYRGLTLEQAVAAPRLHVEEIEGEYWVAHEGDQPVDHLRLPTRRFESLSMYFGGVAAAAWHPVHGFRVAADPRRQGAIAIGRA